MAASSTSRAPTRRPRLPRADRFTGLVEQLQSGPAKPGPLAKSDLAHSLGFLLRLANGVALDRLSQKLEALGLRQTLYSVLLIIDENPGLKQQEVGQALSIQQPNLVALINELAAAGLLERQSTVGDKRSRSLVLTEAGKTRLAEANRLHSLNESELAAAIAPISPDDFRAAMLRILAM